MLERLVIRDFAVARDVTVLPGPGLNVFTGETGAGKSIVVDALAFAFGARRGREVIATGAERAVVQASLRLDDAAVTVERTISLAGRSTARVDGQPATLEELQRIGSRVVDIHGQSEQLAILRPSVQLAVLDQFAGLGALRGEVTTLVRELRETRRLLRSLATDVRERERLVDQLRFEAGEIASAELSAGEDEALHREHTRLSGVGRLLQDASAAIDALDAPAVGDAVRAANDLVARDPSAADVTEAAAMFESGAADLLRALRRYRDGLEEDPGRLAAVSERLDRLARLKRKYGESLPEVIAYGEDAALRLAALTSSEASLEALAAREARQVQALATASAALSAARRGSAGDLVRGIADELALLGMAKASLSVGFSCEDDESGIPVSFPDYEVVITERPPSDADAPVVRAFAETGIDRVEFLASFNPGETPRALSAVASGGETSRFMLALTSVLGAAAEPRLVVFDEVDEGVGGRAGALVGEALARLAARHQVLCVTHLPQVAAFGTLHFRVSKGSDGTHSSSVVDSVEGEARLEELAAMLGSVSEATRAAARELLDRRPLA